MKFTTSDNLIDLLVGQSLYSTPDVAVRELLQNAEDACHLQSFVDPDYAPEIVVRFSAQQNWFEVSDNGLGMDAETFESSFATIGASKTNSPKLQELLNKAGAGTRPIGQFGIGVLSCFGIADVVEVRSRSEGAEPLSLRIRDRRADFENIGEDRPLRGTDLRLILKPNGPMTASQVKDSLALYVRHAAHITIENVDSAERIVAPEQWLLPAWDPSSDVVQEAVQSGHLQLAEAWENLNVGLDSQIILCNAGFLVNKSARVLDDFAVGLRGELNIRPGGLTILMNREGFQQDDRWRTFVTEITAHYRRLVYGKLDSWLHGPIKNFSEDRLRAIQRMVLLILRSPLGQVVGEENVALARNLLPHVVILGDGKGCDFESVVAQARARPPLYMHKTDDQSQVQRVFSDRGQNFSMTETVRSTDLRVSLLKLNGFAVIRVERHDYVLHTGNSNQTVQIHDFDMVSEYCSPMGIAVARVQDAPSDHTMIGSSRDAEAITDLFEMSSALKIQSVESMTDAIIADFNGYILNIGNEEIRSILLVLPDAVGNPVRKDLLSAYLALSTYDVTSARATILRLLTDPEFESKARRTTGRYFRKYLEHRVNALLSAKEANDA